jgi:D-xylulose reductase
VRYTPGCYAIAIELLASGKLDLAPMITKTVPLTQSKEALEAVRSGKELKVVIMNQQ